MKNSKQKKQQGFTLIELMIVVGIIGILSALAVPAYKSYVIKTEANAGVSIPRALLTNIDMYIQEEGSFPEDGQAADFGAATDMSAMGTLAFVKDGDVQTEGTTTFTYGAEATLNGQVVTYTRTGAGWKCEHDIPVTMLADDLKGCERNVGTP